MLIVKNLFYQHSNKDLLFSNVQLTADRKTKLALIGNNGVGKSILLKIIAGELPATQGEISRSALTWFVPQQFGQYDQLSIAQALGLEKKIQALRSILSGSPDPENYEVLDDDWALEERCCAAFKHWGLPEADLTQKMSRMSGGQKTKVFLAGISIHQPELVLLDEPSNHLDGEGRRLLYDFISSTESTLIVVSHDRTLLNLVDTICELSPQGIKSYGGNYDFYKVQKEIGENALNQEILSRQKDLRKAEQKQRETLERQQKLNNRGKAKQEKAGIARIMMNTLKNKAENSSSKLKSVHEEKISDLSDELKGLRDALPDADRMKMFFSNSGLHKGKVLFTANDVNIRYNAAPIWKENLNLQIFSGERLAIHGKNGSGKSSLIGLILGELEASTGTVLRAESRAIYLDQNYSLIDRHQSIYEQVQRFNDSGLEEHELKIRLSRFLFSKDDWQKTGDLLSGGEKMRLALCCLTIPGKAPDVIVLDEPTNNLDLQNIEILKKAVNNYEGTLIVVSHDDSFVESIRPQRSIYL